MVGKIIAVAGSLLLAGCDFLGFAGYSRTVAASPDEVRRALLDLDIRDAPGEPASDPFRSGGVEPMFALTEQGDDMIWTVTSGKDVAVRMIAHLEPIDGGTKTRVTTSVERGNAPDDLVAPAFRSVGVTASLFGVVIEDQLDDLTRPAGLSEQECRELGQELLEGSAPPMSEQSGFAGVARTTLKLNAIEGKLKAAGCDTGFKKFGEPSNELSETAAPPPRTTSGVTFEPGKPMIDVSRGSGRQ